MPTVLLVEDNEANRDMLSRRLERSGWAVLQAVDGRQGVEMAAARVPDIILMDMSLPALDGWEATAILKRQPSTRAIPIIALTAHAMHEHMDKAIRSGCDEFETKPVDFKRLMAKMTSCTGNRSQSQGETRALSEQGALCQP